MRTLLFLSAILFTAAPAFAGNGILELDSKPGGAEVFVDGKKKGTTPETEGQKLSMDLAEGDHVVEVKKEGAGSAKKKIFVGDGVIQPLTLSLAPDAFTNSLSMKFVPVPIKGGKTGGQTILFSVYETRYADFKAFVDATGHDATKGSDGKPMAHCWNRPEWEMTTGHPVVYVSWDDAQAFCQWLTKKERESGKITASQRYRLPSDHEWSCAVGIGEQETAGDSPKDKSGKVAGYPWGAQWPPPRGAGNYDGKENSADSEVPPDAFQKTAPVGSFTANTYGLCDMGGNVWEWCEDWYDPADKQYRVLRGGGWDIHVRDYLRSSCRLGGAPALRGNGYGFRCVLGVSGG